MSGKGEYNAIVEIDDDLIPETPQLEFQDFSMDATGNSAPPLTGSIAPGGPSTGAFNPNQQSASQHSWFSVAYYAQYFDVDTTEVTNRLQKALMHFQGGERFVDFVSDKPDMYVPFWGSLTVACSIILSSSLPWAISSQEIHDYDFSQIWTSMTVIYFYIFLTPLLLFFASRYLGARPNLVSLVSIYGYSSVIWVPTILLCIIPSAWVRWIIVILGGGYSGFFIAKNAYPTFKQADSSAVRTGLILTLIAAHLIFSIVLKIVFLSYTGFSMPSEGNAPPAGKVPVKEPSTPNTSGTSSN
ncbi:hypothetical protein DSO57_1037799 [Entomophthora muscae]|uniref:Uncharacterized protein n=1 Tax=Entomophthora muscae TaxID=34485 RepID=A0ACC2S113_9FUNG|nr:hypothetical protein DSO57_1037799 [Entomophthora muscae]